MPDAPTSVGPGDPEHNTSLLPRLKAREATGMVPALRRLTIGAFGGGLLALAIFNYGFQMIRIPPTGSAAVPYIELLALFASPFLFSPAILRDLRRSAVFPALVMWLLWGTFRIAQGYLNHGFSAIRDGLPVLESIFFVFGFALASRQWAFMGAVRIFPKAVACLLVYALLAPFGSVLEPLTPHLPSTQGNMVPIFFKYINTGMLLIVAAVYYWHAHNLALIKRAWLPPLCLGYTLILWPSRSILLMFVAVLILMLYGLPGSRKMGRLSLVLTLGLAMLLTAGVVQSDLRIPSRLGVLSLSDYAVMFQEINPFAETIGTKDQLTSGSAERLDWWSDILRDVSADALTLTVGMGYGQPLVHDVSHVGVFVREPHNTVISVLGRAGVIGLLLFLYVSLAIARSCLIVLKERVQDPRFGPFCLALVTLLLCTQIYGIGEPPFINPFYTVPYYFSAGILARMTLSKRRPT